MSFHCFHTKENDFDEYWFGDLCGGVRGMAYRS